MQTPRICREPFELGFQPWPEHDPLILDVARNEPHQPLLRLVRQPVLGVTEQRQSLFPLLLSLADGVLHLLLFLEERPHLARQPHLLPDCANEVGQAVGHGLGCRTGGPPDVHDLPDQGFEPVLPQRLEKLIEEFLLAGHRFGADDARLEDGRAVPFQPHFLIGSLAPQPQGEGGDLGTSEVDINAVQIVPQDEARHSPPQIVPVG